MIVLVGVRPGRRAARRGGAAGHMEMRFMSASVRPGG
jgi:hypothetical protein